MKRQRLLRSILYLGTAAGFLACTDHVTEPADDSTGPPRGWTGYAPDASRRVAALSRLLGLAMGDSAAAAAVHEAFAASPLYEHKLVIPVFFLTERGRVVIEGAARQSGRPVEEITDLVRSVPAMDLYLPSRQHRLEWRAGQPAVVAALVDVQSPVYAWTPRGDSVFLDRTVALPETGPAVILLGPREGYLIRKDFGAMLRTAGVVEDAREMDFVPANAQCYEDCEGGGGGGPPAPTDTLWGDTLVTHDIVDNGNPWESNEFEIIGLHPSSSGLTVRCEGMPSTGVRRMGISFCNGNLNKINESAPNETGVTRDDVRVIETDGFSADDWFYGYQDPPPSGAASGSSLSVIDNGLRRKPWVLYKVNYGAGCTPLCTEWVEIVLKW